MNSNTSSNLHVIFHKDSKFEIKLFKWGVIVGFSKKFQAQIAFGLFWERKTCKISCLSFKLVSKSEVLALVVEL